MPLALIRITDTLDHMLLFAEQSSPKVKPASAVWAFSEAKET
jgi:hypothetical protein